MSVSKKEFGQLIRIRRGELGLTQMDLVDMTGISQRYISYYENGLMFPGHMRLMAILDKLALRLEIYAEEDCNDS